MEREKYASQADPKLLAAMRGIASEQGRHFQTVMEDAMREYVARGQRRRSVDEAYERTKHKHGKLLELLAK